MRRLRASVVFGVAIAAAGLAALPSVDAAPREACPSCNGIDWASSDGSVEFVTDRSLRLVHAFQITLRLKQCRLTLTGGQKVAPTNVPFALPGTPDPLVHIRGGRFSFSRTAANTGIPFPAAHWRLNAAISGTGVAGTRATGTVDVSIVLSAKASCTPVSSTVHFTAHETGYVGDDFLPANGKAANAGGG